MARYIDADDLSRRMYHEAFEVDSDMQKWDSGCWIRYKVFENCIAATPTADVVEVVRCKDCKFFPGGYFSDDRIMIETYMHCPNFKDDGFCSYGERREDAERRNQWMI